MFRFTTSLIACLLAWGVAGAAPRPFPKPPQKSQTLKAKDFVGLWTMTWAGHELTVGLYENGTYIEDGYWGHWEGTWSIKDGMFCCQEWPGLADGKWGSLFEWQTKLKPGKRQGKQYDFSLVPVNFKKLKHPKGKPDA